MVRSVPFFLLQKGVEGCCRKMLVLFGCKITACECECRIDVAERPMPVNLGHTCWNALPNMAIDHPPFAKNLPRFPIQRQGLVGLSLIFHDFPRRCPIKMWPFPRSMRHGFPMPRDLAQPGAGGLHDGRLTMTESQGLHEVYPRVNSHRHVEIPLEI